MIHTTKEECGWQCKGQTDFYTLLYHLNFPQAWIMYIIYLYYTYLGSRKRQSKDGFNWGAKKRLCIHAGGLHFYPGSRKGSGWLCTWMWAGTTIRWPCNMTSSVAHKRRYWAINCAEDPMFSLSEAQWGILLESEMKRNKMSPWKLNLNIKTNWIREQRWNAT